MTFPAPRIAVATALFLTLGAAPALADAGDTAGNASLPVQDRGNPHAATLPRDMHGLAAVKALGTHLDAVAAQNDLSAARLTKILTSDDTAWLSEDGQMFYQEEPPSAPVEPPSADVGPGVVQPDTGSGSGSTTTPAYPVAQTFKLHSRPGASKLIFLDFNGAEIKGTGWNTRSNPLGVGVYTGYDSDGHPGTFSTAEDAWIQEVWRQVAETYAPFDVDVTTEDGGPDSRERTTSLDTHFGTQVLFTNSAQAVAQLCNSACLGLAWVGTFSDVDPVGFYQPAALVFTKTTMSATVAAQGAAHEAGHTLGLHHDGTTSQSYYPGTKAWGPVMGSAMPRAVTEFSKGEYAGANQTEDDLAVIQANGLPLRTDDHGSTRQTADALGTQASYAVNGIIRTRSDVDFFSIALRCSTNLTVAATGIGRQSALDLRLDVLNGSGVTVKSSSPVSGYTTASPPLSTGMNASVTVPGAIGTYYLRVDGVGNGDPKKTGWSDYGSLGQYRLTAKGCATATSPSLAANDVQVTRPAAPRIGKAAPGAKGGTSTALVRWLAPTSNGGAAVTKYRVLARRLNDQGRVVRSYGSAYLKPAARSLNMKLPKARYKFVVVAYNRVGASPLSRASNIVRAR
ncbi:M12 family metallo-peptidase [Marmoricola sp. URHB0036]|uniref:M12 family metallo-peptidase n=1 Tax=Marmoricola sp. URHB0036 TaxID=1298863 RepID=UPI0004069013|nr:M12 family metallo-peptidase [Marmoricola sp. URHB0036]